MKRNSLFLIILIASLLVSCSDEENDIAKWDWDDRGPEESPLELIVEMDSLRNYSINDTIYTDGSQYSRKRFYVCTNNLEGHVQFMTADDVWFESASIRVDGESVIGLSRASANNGKYLSPIGYNCEWCRIRINESTLSCDFSSFAIEPKPKEIIVLLRHFPDGNLKSCQAAELIFTPTPNNISK